MPETRATNVETIEVSASLLMPRMTGLSMDAKITIDVTGVVEEYLKEEDRPAWMKKHEWPTEAIKAQTEVLAAQLQEIIARELLLRYAPRLRVKDLKLS